METLKTPSYSFIRVVADKKSSKFLNIEYLSDLLDLFTSYKDVLGDDYYSGSDIEYISEIIDLINEVYPHFYAITKEKIPNKREVIGFVYLDDWHGNKEKLHSCTLTTGFKRKFWGKDVRIAAKEFLQAVFDDYDLVKIKADVFEHNILVKRILKQVGFKKEAVLVDETYKNGKNVNIVRYSLFKDGLNSEGLSASV